jgi:O-antigen/teichoic acid export membrane protein
VSLINNAKWTAVSQFSRVGMQLIGMIVLSRLLAPGDFGAMAMALVVINLANLLRDMGTSAALIQRRELDDDTIGAVFTLNLVIGGVLAATTCATSGVLGSFFNSRDLQSMLNVLAFVFPITSSASVFQSLLERQSKFRLLARIEIVSSLSGLGTAVVLAHKGAGIMCLPAQTLVAAITSAVQLWCVRPWSNFHRLNVTGIKAIISFSGNLTLFNLINYFARNADSLIIGRILGPASLGVYSQAYKIMLFPVQNLTSIATRALFPVISRFQDNPKQAADVYVRLVFLIIGVTGPLMGGVWILREEFIHLVLGNKWMNVVPILAWLAPVGFIQSIVSTTGTVFMAFGRTRTLMRLGIVATILQVSAFLLGANFGLVRVAEFYCIANVINFFVAMHFTMRQFASGLRELLVGIQGPISATVVTLLVTHGLHQYMRSVFSDNRILLFATVVVELLIYATLRYRWVLATLSSIRNPRITC